MALHCLENILKLRLRSTCLARAQPRFPKEERGPCFALGSLVTLGKTHELEIMDRCCSSLSCQRSQWRLKDFPTFIDHAGKLTSQTMHMAYWTAASRLASLNKELKPKFHWSFGIYDICKLLCMYVNGRRFCWRPQFVDSVSDPAQIALVCSHRLNFWSQLCRSARANRSTQGRTVRKVNDVKKWSPSHFLKDCQHDTADWCQDQTHGSLQSVMPDHFLQNLFPYIPVTRQSKAQQVAHRLRFVGSTTFWPFWISGLSGLSGLSGRRSWRLWRLWRLVMANDARHRPSALRNRGPILEALQEMLPAKEGQEHSWTHKNHESQQAPRLT